MKEAESWLSWIIKTNEMKLSKGWILELEEPGKVDWGSVPGRVDWGLDKLEKT